MPSGIGGHISTTWPAWSAFPRATAAWPSALVWLRLGEMLIDESAPLCSSCQVRHHPNPELQERAVRCLRNSIRSAPQMLHGYLALALAYREWGAPLRAATTLRRLLKRFPEHLDTLLWLARHHLRRDEPLAAREFASRARRLKPLDAGIKELVWSVHLASARHYALAAQWDEGREEFAAAVAVDGREPHIVLVQRAAFEAKAGDRDLANRLLDQAQSELGEAAPVWLLMIVEARRYALPVVAEEFQDRWVAALKRSHRSAAAGEMCRTMAEYLVTEVDYPGRSIHVLRLCQFLGRCKRVVWQRRDICHVLEFLVVVDGHAGQQRWKTRQAARRDSAAALLAALAAKARRKFPDEAFFQFLVGRLEIEKGPLACDRRLARECLERAIALAEGTSDRDRIEAAKSARRVLDRLDAFDRSSMIAPDFDDDFDEEDEDEGGQKRFRLGRRCGRRRFLAGEAGGDFQPCLPRGGTRSRGDAGQDRRTAGPVPHPRRQALPAEVRT